MLCIPCQQQQVSSSYTQNIYSPMVVLFKQLSNDRAGTVVGFAALHPLTHLSQHRTLLTLSIVFPFLQLKSDPFIQQVNYAESLVSALQSRDLNAVAVAPLLEAQLSHSDGIRGFFVTYLTANTSTDGDIDANMATTVPPALINAMQTANASALVPLAMMNVIMPTAMQTLHQTAELQQQSKRTARRAMCIIQALLLDQELAEGVMEHCRTVRAVAASTSQVVDKQYTLFEYWQDFFEKWGYGSRQRKDIVDAMNQLLL